MGKICKGLGISDARYHSFVIELVNALHHLPLCNPLGLYRNVMSRQQDYMLHSAVIDDGLAGLDGLNKLVVFNKGFRFKSENLYLCYNYA